MQAIHDPAPFLALPDVDAFSSALLTIESLDADVKEAQTYFESRLAEESAPMLDNHFTPGNPFTLRVGIQFKF